MPKRLPCALVLACILLASLSAQGLCSEPVAAGGTIPPDMSLLAPAAPEDRAYLGLDDGPVFKLSAIKADFVILEVIGVYCPQCHIQAPFFDKFFARLSADPVLGSKIKMVAMAAGATTEELAYLRETGKYKYPVASDPDYVAHKQVGEPKTPYTMLVNSKGQVLYAQVGIIEDVNALYEQFATLTR